jgi:hypothetical protein
MVRRTVIVMAAVMSAFAGLAAGGPGRSATAPTVRSIRPQGCPALPAFAKGAPGLAAGRGVWAASRGTLGSVGAGRTVSPRTLASLASGGVAATSSGSVVIKHVASRPGVGTAFVVDRAGADATVALTPDGPRTFAAAGEASHPALSRGGSIAWSEGSAIAIHRRGSGATVRLAAPIEGATVFAPMFVTERRLVAVVSRPSAADPHAGERVSDLWTSPVVGARWRALTRFRTTGDRWAVIRTPIRVGRGIEFVRVSARASATGEPTFELWRYRDGRVTRVRRLDGERYLAGRVDGRRLWNRPDPRTGRHVLEIGSPTGPRAIGCGAVAVDPIDVVDPDLRGAGSFVPARADRPEPAGGAGGAAAAEVAVIVGDFPSEAEADVVVRAIREAYPSSDVAVVTHADAPVAIRPGVFGALLHLADDADPTSALAAFRTALPDYSSNSWIVTP